MVSQCPDNFCENLCITLRVIPSVRPYFCPSVHLSGPTLILPAKFRVNWHFGEEVKKIQDGRHGGHLEFQSELFCYFHSTSHRGTSNEGLELTGLTVKEKSHKIYVKMASVAVILNFRLAFPFRRRKIKTDFHDDGYGSHLRYPIGTILLIFDLQVTKILPTKF